MRNIITILIILITFNLSFAIDPEKEIVYLNNKNLNELSMGNSTAKIINLLGNDIRGIWMMKNDGSGSVEDESSNLNDGTLKNGLDFTSQSITGFGYQMTMDPTATEYIEIGDDDVFSFGDGSNDEAFSMVVLCRLNDTSTDGKMIFSKYDYDSSVGEYFWRVEWTALENRSTFYITDNGAISGSSCYATDVINQNNWTFLAMTYSGVGGSSCLDGVTLYSQGVSKSITKTQGTYTAMSNTTAKLNIGNWNRAASPACFGGDIAFAAIVGDELTQEQIHALYKYLKGLYNL